ncbi:acyl transferase domain-containing protein [Aspergillus oleicola]
MAAVGLYATIALRWINKLELGQAVKVACINSPESVTVGGDCDGVNALVAALQADGIFARPLKTDGKAYHSHHMVNIGKVYRRLLDDGITFTEEDTYMDDGFSPAIRMYSTVSGKQVESGTLRSSVYWQTNLESPVRFHEGLVGLLEALGDSAVVELRPHAALQLPITQSLGQSTVYIGTLKWREDSIVSLLSCIGQFYVHGYPVDFSKLLGGYNHGTPRFIPDLALYPWHYEEDSLWNKSRVSRESRQHAHPRHELLGSEVSGGNRIVFGRRNLLSLDLLTTACMGSIWLARGLIRLRIGYIVSRILQQ